MQPETDTGTCKNLISNQAVSETSEKRMDDSINRVGETGYMGKNPVRLYFTAYIQKNKPRGKKMQWNIYLASL